MGVISLSSVTFDVKQGQVYYVKGTVGVGVFVGRPHLIVASTDVGEREIINCKLIPPPKNEEEKEKKDRQ